MARSERKPGKHRIVTVRLVVVSVVVGVVLAVGSVPVAAFVAWRATMITHMHHRDLEVWISTPDGLTGIQRTDLPGGTEWFTSVVDSLPEGVDPSPRMTIIDPADDPRPAIARPDYPGFQRSHEYMACGWPLRAAEGQRVVDGGLTPASRMEFLVELSIGNAYARVPWRPIWPGLLGNTLFYAAFSLALLVCLRLIRTRRRRARGRCEACNYELGEGVSVCPECGLAARPAREGN